MWFSFSIDRKNSLGKSLIEEICVVVSEAPLLAKVHLIYFDCICLHILWFRDLKRNFKCPIPEFLFQNLT